MLKTTSKMGIKSSVGTDIISPLIMNLTKRIRGIGNIAKATKEGRGLAKAKARARDPRKGRGEESTSGFRRAK